MKDLFLIRGVSGSGKTTLVKSITEAGDVSVCNDDFMVNAEGVYEFDWKRLDEVAAKSKEVASKAMQKGVKRIFVHNTFTTESELEPYFAFAEKYKYRVFSIIVENRHGGVSVQGTPEPTREKQRSRFSLSL